MRREPRPFAACDRNVAPIAEEHREPCRLIVMGVCQDDVDERPIEGLDIVMGAVGDVATFQQFDGPEGICTLRSAWFRMRDSQIHYTETYRSLLDYVDWPRNTRLLLRSVACLVQVC